MDKEKPNSKEELLVEAGEESFPASDPPSWTLGSSKAPVENKQEMIPISCKQCGKELPRSVGEAPESKDYVSYFCCESCRNTWESEHSNR